jgi:hypothetical protein
VDNDKKSYYEQALTVTSFLGGITIAALVLIMEEKDKFLLGDTSQTAEYQQVLITGFALTSALFIFASIKLISAAASGNVGNWARRFLFVSENGGLTGLLLLLPLMTYSFSPDGAIVLAIVEVVSWPLVYLTK